MAKFPEVKIPTPESTDDKWAREKREALAAKMAAPPYAPEPVIVAPEPEPVLEEEPEEPAKARSHHAKPPEAKPRK